MFIWMLIVLLMGLLLCFIPERLAEEPDRIRWIGIAITLICVGISVRTSYLRRKGVREDLSRKVKELQAQLEALKKGEPPRSPESPA